MNTLSGREYVKYDRKLFAALSRCAWESLKVFMQSRLWDCVGMPEKNPFRRGHRCVHGSGPGLWNTKPKDMETKLAAYAKVRELNAAIEDIYGTIQCRELLKRHATEADVAQRKHHAIICRKVVSDVAGLLFDMVE